MKQKHVESYEWSIILTSTLGFQCVPFCSTATPNRIWLFNSRMLALHPEIQMSCNFLSTYRRKLYSDKGKKERNSGSFSQPPAPAPPHPSINTNNKPTTERHRKRSRNWWERGRHMEGRLVLRMWVRKGTDVMISHGIMFTSFHITITLSFCDSSYILCLIYFLNIPFCTAFSCLVNRQHIWVVTSASNTSYDFPHRFSLLFLLVSSSSTKHNLKPSRYKLLSYRRYTTLQLSVSKKR